MKQRTWYLMRHGETDLNKARCFYGSKDVSINETGIRQAKQLRQIMSDKIVTEVYTSGLKRSHETAEIVFLDHEIKTLSNFDERSFGRWEGKSADEIQTAYPVEWQTWLESPFEITPIGAEPFLVFQDRVWQMTKKLLKEDGDIAIIAHLGVLRLIYQYLVDRRLDFWEIDVPQGTVLVLDERDGIWEGYYIKEDI